MVSIIEGRTETLRRNSERELRIKKWRIEELGNLNAYDMRCEKKIVSYFTSSGALFKCKAPQTKYSLCETFFLRERK